MMKHAVPADFQLVYEDKDLLVVDKPAHLLVHPTRPGGPPTLWHALCGLLAYERANGGQVSILNRLDRETSGLTLVAKNQAAARDLGKEMMRRRLGKRYLAIVRGWPEHDAFDVEAPLIREGEVRPCPIFVRQCVHPAGRPCATSVRVLRRFSHADHPGQTFALVEATPFTGRMHQIRVHMAHAGHPLVGDKLYTGNGAEYLEFLETGYTPDLARRLLHDRHALHSSGISARGMIWQSGLPADLEAWMSGTIP